MKLPVGTSDSTLGRSYAQIAREGWGEQKSQNGGANPSLSGPATASYHLWAVAPAAQPSIVNDDNEIARAFTRTATSTSTPVSPGWPFSRKSPAPGWLAAGLAQHRLTPSISFESKCPCNSGLPVAQALAPIYRQTLDLTRQRLPPAISIHNPRPASSSNSTPRSTSSNPRWPTLSASTSSRSAPTKPTRRPPASAAPQPTKPPPASLPAKSSASTSTPLRPRAPRASKKSGSRAAPAKTGRARITGSAIDPAAPVADPVFTVHAADNAAPTAPFFTRPNIEQPYYDISNPQWRERSFAPYPLDAWAEFTFDGLPIRIGEVVQTLQRVTGPGGFYEPLVVTPAIGVSVDPQARILPLDGSALPVRVTVHTQAAADGTVTLKLPDGWHSNPAQAEFHRKTRGRHRSHHVFCHSCRCANRRLRHQGHRAVCRPLLTIPAGTASATPACDPITNTPPPNSRPARSMSSSPPASASATSWAPAISSPKHWKAWASRPQLLSTCRSRLRRSQRLQRHRHRHPRLLRPSRARQNPTPPRRLRPQRRNARRPVSEQHISRSAASLDGRPTPRARRR